VARQRDLLSIGYDTASRRALVRAIRKRPAGHQIFVQSPGREFSDVDPGGRTRHERAFTRSLYYHVVQIPRRQNVPQEWSLRLRWGKIENRGGRYGRRVELRMFPASAGYRHVQRHGGGLRPTGTGY
jgi:hypothetical protein